jgi:ketosteroid isomerase-like protein
MAPKVRLGGENERRNRVSDPAPDSEWERFWAATTEANSAMVRGDSDPLKAIYSHSDDITVMGGFGGMELGWDEVGSRLEWAASQFREGSFEQRVVSRIVESDVACVVTIERNEVRIAGSPELTTLELRVTQVFHREDGTWRMVHRHADPLTNKQRVPA